ncbi:MAG TPA: DUF885 family protein [Fimbriimonadaceae bacterium]|nr:DUF885 family protein [Fimbriimonadaceae bacterium]
MVPVALVLTLALSGAALEMKQSADPDDLHVLIARYEADRNDLIQLYPIESSPARRTRLGELYRHWKAEFEKLPFEKLSPTAKADDVLVQNHLVRAMRQLDLDAAEDDKIRHFIPFAQTIIELEEARIKMVPVEPEKVAAELGALTKTMAATKAQLEKERNPDKHVADEAAQLAGRLRTTLERWFKFYDGYDPMFTWWVEAPFKEAAKSLDEFGAFLREKLVGVKPDDHNAIVGHPVGRESLMADLQNEMIPYTPEELIAEAQRQYSWCETEMKQASRMLGFGDDWKKALEHVKGLHVEPGKQPALIKQLATEAIDFVEGHDLVTVPAMAKETLRMEMMSPDRQLVNPFFLGGPLIIVSYPTSAMSQDAKLMSMRGNNVHFSRATVQHELIPGHHLQDYMESRYRPYRRPFGTPFWVEGWAVYWEMVLWDLGFPKSPEDRIGMLFWRMHRCARVEFSLKFHLGQMSAQQCIDMLVDKVGHERATAEGEVRRSFNGSYPPLYQAAYLVGALQFRALRHELVDSGKLSEKAFHDAILHENSVPVAMVRAVLTGDIPAPGSKPAWRFLDGLSGENVSRK